MIFRWVKGKTPKDNSLGLFHAEAGVGSVENAAIAYQAQSVIAAGANSSGVALLSSLTNLFLSLFLLKVPSLIESPRASTRRLVVMIALANTATWVPIVMVMTIFSHVNPLILTGLWIINIVPTVLLGPMRDYWLANIVPSEKMGRYLSWRSVISGGAYLATFYVMGMILETTANKNLVGFAVVLLFALLASAASAFFYSRIRPVTIPENRNKDENPGFITFLKNARSSHLGVFILFVSMFTFATNLAGPLFASYMMGELNFGYMTFAAVVSCEFIARVISLTFWGKMVDKSGSLKVLKMVAYLIPFVPVLWLFSTNIAYLCLIQAFSGVVWSAFDLSVQTFIYKATSPQQRLRYIVYYKSLTSFSVALGALCGALLVNNIVPIFGSNILTLFLLSGILRLIVARVMMPKLTQEGIPGAVIHEELATELAALDIPVYQGGLYYHPEAWGRFTRRAYIIGNSIGKTIGSLNPVKLGLFYQPNQWAKYTRTADTKYSRTEPAAKNGLYNNPQSWVDYVKQQGVTQPAAPMNRQPVREGLYYHKEEWAKLQTNHNIVNKSARKPVARQGLFHNPDRWVDYLKQGALLNATTMQSTGNTALRQPVYYHPEAWKIYRRETPRAIRLNPVAVRKSVYQPDAWKRFSAVDVTAAPKRAMTPAGLPARPIRKEMVHQPRLAAAARKTKLATVPVR